MSLSQHQLRELKKSGHPLKPVVIIGNAGLTQAVVHETDRSLAHHELIKVRINAADRHQRRHWIDELCRQTTSVCVQRIGHIALIYRQNPDR